MDLINTPISRVSCPNVENPETQADQFTLLQYSTTFYHFPYLLSSSFLDYRARNRPQLCSQYICAVYRWHWSMYYNLLNNHLNDLRMAMVIVVWWVFMH